MSRFKGLRSLFAPRQDVSSHGRRRRSSRRAALAHESLEARAMLAVTVTSAGSEVYIDYSQGVGAPTSNQNVIIEVEDVFFPFTQTRLNVYVTSNPVLTPLPTAPVQTYTFLGIEHVYVDVPNQNLPGVNNNSLTIKGLTDVDDRIIVAGSGTTASARWSDQTSDELQVLFDIEGIDDLTVTAGGVINVSGTFTNDTGDASIRAIGQVVERESDQHTATITVAENTPFGSASITPKPWLYSNTIEIVGAEIDIYSDIEATDEISLWAGDSAAGGVRSNLVLPFDITVTGNATTGAGVLDLFSTQSIIQLQSSTIRAPSVVAVSNQPRETVADGPWMIDLGSEGNDFDTISLGMLAVPGDAPNVITEGRIGIRDCDDLVVDDFGILAATGRVRLDVAGALTITAPIQATGLIIETDHSLATSAGAIMRLGDQGLTIYANDTFDSTATGNVTLAGPITVNDTDTTVLVSNKIEAAGVTILSGGFFCPLAGSTSISSTLGVTIAAPVQVGFSKLDANSTTLTVYDHDLILVSTASTITVLDVAGNSAVPYAIQATNLVSFDALGAIDIAGEVFAGTIYGNTAGLAATQALPAITVRGRGAVTVLDTGALITSANENDYQTFANSLLGAITIGREATQVNIDGRIDADGAVTIGGVGGVRGDVYVYGPITARERVWLHSATGSIDIQGPVESTGISGTYAHATGLLPQRVPNVVITATNGLISTSGAGEISAGTANFGILEPAPVVGEVRLTAQQDIVQAAAIDTPGRITLTSKLGMVDSSALLRTNNLASSTVVYPLTISAGNGIVQSDVDMARIVTDSLVLTNTGAGGMLGDIDLRAKNNSVVNQVATQPPVSTVTATNLSTGGGVYLANNAALQIGAIRAVRDEAAPSTVWLAVNGGITQDTTSEILANDLYLFNTSAAAITLTNATNNVDHFSAQNPGGDISYTDADGFETGAVRIAPVVTVTAGGVGYTSTFTTVTIAPPVGGGIAATASATVVGGVVTGITVLTPGSGYLAGETPAVTIVDTSGVGIGASATAVVAANAAPAVAVSGKRVTLQAQDAASVIRVVGGLQYSTLSLVSGSSTQGQVEFVTTSTGDNPRSGAFAGTLRDMIRYVNANTGLNGGSVQPMSLVFDEAGLAVDVVGLQAALPALTKPVGFDGGRLEETLLLAGVDRLGLTDAGLPGPRILAGLTFGIGSSGSSITTVAAFGFARGSAIVLNSAANAVEDVWIGLRADGSVPVIPGVSWSNRNGIDVSGATAINNRIGTTVFDPRTANLFGGNQMAVLIRNGASATNVQGNIIGEYADPVLGVIGAANGNGVQINNGSGNLIGNRDAVQWDNKPSMSNVIAGNSGFAINIFNTKAGLANRIRNNLIDGNGTGVNVSGSRSVVIGGLADNAGNVIINQSSAGIAVRQSETVNIIENQIGVVPADLDGVATLAGNLGDGIMVTGSKTVTVAGNVIQNNGGNGVAILAASTGVSLTDNEIGGSFDPGSGPQPAGNALDGVAIKASTGNTVGSGNRISNNLNGVSIVDARVTAATRTAPATTGNRVLGSEIFANLAAGVRIAGGSGSLIGGTKPEESNVITQNAGEGVRIEWSALTQAATGHTVRGNFIGTNANEEYDAALGNGADGVVVIGGVNNVITENSLMNNGGSGVQLQGGNGTMVGGLVSELGNLISGNLAQGVAVVPASGLPATLAVARSHAVMGNQITQNGMNGVAVSGSPGAAVTVSGITVGQRVTSTKVEGVGNVITENALYGVYVSNAQQVGVQGNSIALNGLAGLEVAAGANASAAPVPLLRDAVIRQRGGTQQLEVTFDKGGLPYQQYSIEVFAFDGVAQRSLGRQTVTADGNGNLGPFKVITLTTAVEYGEEITITATALRFGPGSTSSESNAVAARPAI